MCSARRPMVFNICVKFHENMSSRFKVMERTGKLLTDTHTEKTKTIYTIAYLICRGYNQRYGSCVLHVVSWFNICAKFHENMSGGFKLMERTRKLLTQRERERERRRKLYTPMAYEGISKSFEPNMERARNLDLFCFIFQRSPLPTPHTCPI